MKRVAVLTLWLASVVFVAAQAQSPSSSVTDWIRANAIKLSTVEAGHGFADIQPLKQIIGNARIVSLGEATHGTREFFQLKHRMLEFLATEMGFTIFSIEASMPEAYKLNDYVLNGIGDPATLLRGMYFWTWDTEEVLDMIRWMRSFNASGKGRVQFTGFDMQTPTGAIANLRTFAEKFDPQYGSTLLTAAQGATRVQQASQPSTTGSNFGFMNSGLPTTLVAGKKIRFSGFIKTEDVRRNYAGLWFRANGPTGVVAFDNMQTRGATGTSDWKQYVIELDVPASTTNVVFGALFPGDGTAWYDDLALEIDGKPYVDAAVFDFGFEAPTIRGFQTGGTNYRVELDSRVAHAGKQSVKMTFTLPLVMKTLEAAVAAPTPASMIPAYQDILWHLDSHRAQYRAAGATDWDIEWAIQNARVVMQGLQMRAQLVSRDRSMADNVKWILDRNPSAKIVLWAHNMHVATAGTGFTPMVGELRQMFGREMFTFGFAFNQGSFQAVPQGGVGALRDFTVPPLPSTTLDATLASAGMRLFALDLRNAHEWFRTARTSREIGSMYPDGSPDAFTMTFVVPNAFDALLFVESTTAARKNPR